MPPQGRAPIFYREATLTTEPNPEDTEAWIKDPELVKKFVESRKGALGRRTARPDEPILHDLHDETEVPMIMYHNSNYRTSRKFINYEKYRIMHAEALLCARSAGEAKWHKCYEVMRRMQAIARVCSNIDRGPNNRRRDVGYIYTNYKLGQIQKECEELEVENIYPPPYTRTW